VSDQTQCCRTCKHLDVPIDKAGRRVVRKDRAYLCVIDLEPPRLPDSVTRGWTWYPIQLAKTQRKGMCGEEGTNCPCYEKR
jgi:hypothetical protein